jgi:hypothetical protein
MAARTVSRTVDLPWLLPWVRVALLIREIRSTTWDEATWPTARAALGKAIGMQAKMRRRGWWN